MQTDNHKIKMTASVLGATAIVLMSAHAFAQGTGGDVIEEIVITALKRSTTVQDIPTTVQVISGDSMRNAAIVSIDQITQVVPGVRIQTAPAGLVNPTMRGLGSSPSNNSFEQTVGLFIDGVFLGHPRDYTLALFDIERIELLKGTQSAVLGKNTSVGAISVVTKKPGNELAAEASYTHEFELGGHILDAAVNLPISDTLALRVAGQLNRQDGHLENSVAGRDEPKTKSGGVRATLRWTPTDDLTWTVSAQHSEYRQIGYPFYAGRDSGGLLRQTAALYGDPNFIAAVNDMPRQTGRAGDVDLGIDTKGQRYTSDIVWSLGDYTITALTGYSKYDDFQMVSLTGTINNPGLRSGREANKSFSQELRIVSPDTGRFTWLAGVYYYHDKWDFDDTFDILPMAGTPISGATRTYYRQKTETISGFAQGTLELVDDLKATIGIRYDDAKKHGDYRRDILRPGLFTSLVYRPFDPTALKRSESFFDYSGSLQYTVFDNTMLYASYATGSKGGGFQVDPTTIDQAEFPDETAKTIEVGAKIDLGQGSRLNLAVFNTKVKDYQIAFFQGTNFVVRADQVRSRGAEAEIFLNLTEGLSASANVTYADAKKTVPIANSIDGLPFAPKWSGVAKINYNTSISDSLTFAGEVMAEFRSKQHLNDVLSLVEANPDLLVADGYAKFNARLAIAHEQHGLEVAFIAKNIFDKAVVNYAFPAIFQTGGMMINTDQPRTLAVQLSVKY